MRSDDDIYKEFDKNQKDDPLPGKGKPLPQSALTGDVFDKTLKHNHYLPPWIKQQHKVRDALSAAAALTDPEQLEQAIEQINKEIRQYNRQCPPVMQKGLVTAENLKQRLDSWD